MHPAAERRVCWRLVVLLSVVNLVAASGALGATSDDLQLVEAVKSRDGETVRAVLDQQVDVNTAQADGATALHWAAYWNDLETADLLIFADAEVNAANEYGVTPLSLACANRNDAMVERLLSAGADPNAPLVATGETVLMTCARTGSVGGGHGAADTRRGRARAGVLRRTNGPDVGGEPATPRGDTGTDRARRRRPRAIARHTLGHQQTTPIQPQVRRAPENIRHRR